ncbi:MAG: chromate resistance protein, partial [Methylococcaceae bacterium]|nr:chromate resistance protein [Methylococcaceae bacterium]
MNWIILIISLPNENASVRMRVWRAVKASGAAVLRDGVYLLPEQDSCRLLFTAIASDVQSGGGSTSLLRVESLDGSDFAGLFDRQEAYASLLIEIEKVADALNNNIQDAIKQLRKLRKTFTVIAEIDFFPGEAQKQIDT